MYQPRLKLSALTILAGIATASLTSIAYSQTAEIREREVYFKGTNDVTLSGTLSLPASSGKFPAILFISGSGPTDRDGNSSGGVKTDLFKLLATSLAKNGIASLRFDKRVTGNARKLIPRTQNELSEYCSWEYFVGDAEEAFRFLQKQPEIVAKSTGIFGHSEGGMLALQMSNELKSNPPAVLVIAGTPGRKIDVILHDQLSLIMMNQKAPPETAAMILKKNAEICDAIRKTGVVPNDVPPGLAALYPAYLGKFLHSELAFDPIACASSYEGAVLILQGEKDFQVSATLDAPLLEKALKKRVNGRQELFIAPGASHNLKAHKSDSDPGFEGAVEPTTLQKLLDWVKSNLKKG